MDLNILTFVIEDWFHILDTKHNSNHLNWGNFDSRVHFGTNLILDILEKERLSATFFVVGWIAKKYPDIIKKISNRGYEIGSHTYFHQLVYNQDRKIFFNDVDRSIKTIEDISGKKVISFRAPGFSINEETKWAFDILYNLGIKIDCSIFPSKRSHGGFSSFEYPFPSIIKYNGIQLKEFPINYCKFMKMPIIFSGGGYFRLLPYPVIHNLTKKSRYVMSYFHPRDFDLYQPFMNELNLIGRFKS